MQFFPSPENCIMRGPGVWLQKREVEKSWIQSKFFPCILTKKIICQFLIFFVWNPWIKTDSTNLAVLFSMATKQEF